MGVYILDLDQSWRLTAHTSLMGVVREYGYPWSLFLIEVEMRILGYSIDAIDEHVAKRRAVFARESFETLFACIPRAQLHALEHAGWRAFPPEFDSSQATLIRLREERPVVEGAEAAVPKDTLLLRFAVSPDFAESAAPLAEDPTQTVPFPDLEAEDVLLAVKEGRKGMELTGGGMRWSPDESSWYHHEIEQLAFDHELPVTLRNQTYTSPPWPEEKQLVDAFLHSFEQSWRLPAFDALRKAMNFRHTWSIPGEHLFSLFLGYHTEHIEVWLARIEETQASYGAFTVHLLAPQTEYDQLAPLAWRAFDRQSDVTTWRAFRIDSLDRLKANAIELLPSDTVLCRIALETRSQNDVLNGEWHGDDHWLGRLEADIRWLNSKLRCGIERWTEAGWKRQLPDL